MYVIAIYDIRTARVTKVLRLFRRYLHWIQNSAFEGELTEAQLADLKAKAEMIIVPEEDSIIYFTIANGKWLEKRVAGREKNNLDYII